MKFTIGFSPCPNDTFIFDALVNKKIDTGNIELEHILADVETLNQWSLAGKLDFTKLSYGVLPEVLDKYVLLDSGSALGRGVGPLLICKPGSGLEGLDPSVPVAIPGEHTTAHMLFSIAFPDMRNKVFMRYNEIEDFVSDGRGLGVIIHENRFTYEGRGLKKIRDLGKYWEQSYHVPIPLGGIVAKRSIDPSILEEVTGLIKKSIEYAFDMYPALSDFVKGNAQEMSETVMRKHIELYVNDFSTRLGKEGKDAVNKLIEVSNKVCNRGKTELNVFAD
jgi:1,4-dihydroxy-6-naphthoate synthase